MDHKNIKELILIAGGGTYPLELAASARAQGLTRIFVLAFNRETDKAIERLADEVVWLPLGQVTAAREALKKTGIRHAVMAGRVTPTHIFSMRIDTEAIRLLSRITTRNAHTVFGSAGDELGKIGIELLPAYLFMERAMPAPGLLTVRSPTPEQQGDIALGIKVAKATSALEIGQTVVVKGGQVLAVEALEGTDDAIERGGRIGGPGAVVVKVAKHGHDMRFDIPIIGPRTIKTIAKIKGVALAVEAGRTIILERPAVIAAAEKQGVAMIAIDPASYNP